jgi:type I restriction enzyme S subunit
VSSFADEIIHLRNAGTWSGGGTPSKANADFWNNGDIPWVSPKDMKTFELHDSQDKITAKAVEASPAKLVPAGSVLMVVRSGILAHTFPVAIARRPVTLNQDMKAITPKAGLSSEFLAYQLRAQASTILNSCTKSGTTVASVETKQLQALPIWVPSTELQSKIVEELDKQLSRLGATVITLQGIQDKLKQARASILKAAVEGRLVEREAEPDADQAFHEIAEILNKRKNLRRPKWKTPLQASKLTIKSHVPAHWQAATIDQLCDVATGATPRKSDIKYWKNGHIPWITSSACNAKFVDEASDFVTDDALRETNLSLYPSGTILIAMYGEGKTRGQHTMLRIEATTNQAMAALSTSCLEDPTVRWFRIFLDSNYLEMRRKSSGGVQPNLNLSIVKSIALPFPPITEQVEIADEVDRRFSVLDQVEATVTASLARCGKLRQAILKRAFRG